MYPEFCPFVVMEDGECAYMDEADDGDASLGTSSSSNRNHPPECKQFNGLDGQPDIGPCVGAQAFSADVVAPYYDTYPSGLCPFGTEPDGVTCTYSYKILGYLSIDQLVGITAITTNSTSANSSLSGYPAVDNVQQAATKYYKNYNAFCKAGGIEFHSYDQDKTLGLSNVTAIPFWKKPSSLEANIARTKQMIALYNELVDESTNHMQKLPTDFDALRDKNPACYENGLACYDAALGCQRHSFPVLEKVSRTVSDSELRSGILFQASPSFTRLTMAELYAEVADEEQRLARGTNQRQYWDRKTFSSFAEQQRAMNRSSTLYIGNLSFFTSEVQLYELFSRVGTVKRVIMGLDRFKKTPCGFCFVEYNTHDEAQACAQFLSETRLDNRVVRCEMDGGFREGRQFGRGLSGGQVRDDRRSKDDYDAGRGGYGRGDDATADGHHFRRSAHAKRPRGDSTAGDEPPASRRRPESPKEEKQEENPRFRHREDEDREGEVEKKEQEQEQETEQQTEAADM
ncbi:hypothetical protein JM18_007758 [Phytophthora kernoviae]|uniref:Nuclear cap-binding protein subunit 2 n=1 Tax=Phytophthora kernoviae TaxID=325452 RepID=A0A921SCI9_9STRA|nr:hypothetical protein JM18_007758 [Phytophthora kernoviae]